MSIRRYPQKRRKGISLVITVSIMLVLSILAITFVRLATYERVAADNFSAYVDAKLTAYSGLDYALAVMYTDLRTTGRIDFTGQRNPVADNHKTRLLYTRNDADGAFVDTDDELTDLNGNRPTAISDDLRIASRDRQIVSLYLGEVFGRFSHSGTVGRVEADKLVGRYEPDGNFYALKIKSASSGLNVNSHIAQVSSGTLADSHHGQANAVLNRLIKDLAERCGIPSGTATTIANTLCPGDRDVHQPVWNNTGQIIAALASVSGVSGGARAAFVNDHLATATDHGKINANGFITCTPHNVAANRQLQDLIRIRALDSIAALNSTVQADQDKAQEIAEIIRPTNAILAKKLFPTMTQVREAVEDIIPDGNAEEADREKFLSNLTTSSFISPRTVAVNESRSLRSPAIFHEEARAAVNINTASDELLQTLIANIQCRAVAFANATSTFNDVTFLSGELASFPNETQLDNVPTAFNMDFATGSAITNIVSAIRTRLNGATGEFIDRADFDAFLESLVGGASNFPTIDTAATSVNVAAGTWNRLAVDALKSNFSPSVNDNYLNPNSPAHRRISAGELANSLGSGAKNFHTTEFCFHSLDQVEITSLGRIVSQNGEIIVASAGINAEIKFGDMLTHVTQNDFSPPFNSVNNAVGTMIAGVSSGTRRDSISKPVNRLHNADIEADTYVGLVENRTTFSNSAANIYITPETFAGAGNGDTNAFSAGAHDSPRSQVGRHNESQMTSKKLRTSGHTNLAADGLVQRGLFYNDPDNPGAFGLSATMNVGYFIDTAFSDINEDPDDYATGRSNVNPNLDGASDSAGDNISNRRGTLEFWIKLDIDSLDNSSGGQGVGVGFFAASIASGFRTARLFEPFHGKPALDTLGNNRAMRDGAQMFLYRNSLGTLRFSRIYWAMCFSETGVSYGAAFASDIDNKRKISRRDAEVSIANWNAHEWHHVRVDWDDKQQNENGFHIFIDGAQQTVNYGEIDKNRPGENWSALNEREPMDGLFINGFFRRQKVPEPAIDKGSLFRFQGGNNETHFQGHATVDQVMSFSNDNINRANHNNRYLTGVVYRNEFVAPQRSFVGSIRWSGLPASVTSPTTVPGQLQIRPNQTGSTTNVTMNVVNIGGNKEIAVPDTLATDVSNFTVNQGGVVRYQFTLNPRTTTSTSLGQLPASLDSVTLSFVHVSPKVTITEFF